MLRYLMLCLVALGVCSPPALAVYDATSGQWLTRDPAKYVDGPNLYRYAGAVPVGRTDPFGLCSQVLPEPIEPGIDRYIIDSSCGAIDPVQSCVHTNSEVGAALHRYYTDCANSQRGRVTIVCNQAMNSILCSKNQITLIRSFDCGSLAHELLHAADMCLTSDRCSHSIALPSRVACASSLCWEARASSRGTCCDKSHAWRRGRSYAKCVWDMRNIYVRDAGIRCKNIPRALRQQFWDSCAAADEASGCSGAVPPMQPILPPLYNPTPIQIPDLRG